MASDPSPILDHETTWEISELVAAAKVLRELLLPKAKKGGLNTAHNTAHIDDLYRNAAALELLYLKNLGMTHGLNLPEDELDTALLVIRSEIDRIIAQVTTKPVKVMVRFPSFSSGKKDKNSGAIKTVDIPTSVRTLSEKMESVHKGFERYGKLSMTSIDQQHRAKLVRIIKKLTEQFPIEEQALPHIELQKFPRLSQHALEERLKQAKAESLSASSFEALFLKNKVAVLEGLQAENSLRYFLAPALPKYRDGPFMSSVHDQEQPTTGDPSADVSIRLAQLRETLEGENSPSLTELARGLSNLASALTQVDLPIFVWQIRAQHTVVYERLIETAPAVFDHALATSQRALARALADMDRDEEALVLFSKSLDAFRTLSTESPAVFTPDLLTASYHASIHLYKVDMQEKAMSTLDDALQKWYQQNEQTPWYSPNLVCLMHERSRQLLATNRQAEALQAQAEAIERLRPHYTAYPKLFISLAADCFVQLARCYLSFAQREKALTAIREGVRHFKKLNAEQPARYSDKLGDALHMQGEVLLQCAYATEALDSFEETVKLRRRALERLQGAVNGLAGAPTQKRARSVLAGSLDQLATCFVSIGCDADANSAWKEAEELRRE